MSKYQDFVRMAGLLLCALSTLAASASSGTQLPDLSELLKPVTYPLLTSRTTPGSLQHRLQAVTQFMEGYCRNSAGMNEIAWPCLWTEVVQEHDLVGTELSRNSPDSQRLFLTLAARLHPENLFAGFVQRENGATFDALFARYLLSHRLMRELWPSVESLLIQQKVFQEPADRFIEPWLTTETPWSFALRSLMRLRYGRDKKACAMKMKIGRFMRGSLNLIDEDSVLKRVADGSALPESEFSTNDQRMNLMIAATLDNEVSGYSFVARDLSDRIVGHQQIREYLKYIEADSHMVIEPFAPESLLCRTLPRLIDESRRNSLPFLETLSRTRMTCQNHDDRVTLSHALEKGGHLYRFHFFHLRTAIAYYPFDKRTAGAHQRRRVLERALRNNLAVIKRLRELKLPELEPSEDAEKIKWNKPMLMHFYQVLKGLESL